MSVDKTISELPSANPLSGNELFPVTQNGETRKSSVTSIISHVKGQLTSDSITEGQTNLYFRTDRADARVNLHAARTDNPHNVTKEQLGLSNVTNIKNNFNSVANPTNSDDTDAGYTQGSLWLNTNTNKLFVCVSAASNAANWTLDNASTKNDIGLGNVENTALSTWTGSSNITTVGQSAVTAHNAALIHNNLSGVDSNRHIDHGSVSILTPSTGGLSGGGNISANRSIVIDLASTAAITSFDGNVDKLPVWDQDLNVLRTVLPSQIAAMSAIRNIEVLTGNKTVTASDRGKFFIVDTTGISITFAPITALDKGFFVSIACPKNNITYTVFSDATDNINGMPSEKFGKQDGFLVIADDIHTLHTVGDKPEVIKIEHQEADNVNGGTFTSGSYVDRTLNTKLIDTAGLCTLASNTMTLLPGTYLLEASLCVGPNVSNHKSQVFNSTSTTVIFKSIGVNGTGVPSYLTGRITPAVTSGYKIQHRCTFGQNNIGFGNTLAYGENEVYASVFLQRVSGITI